MERKARPPLRRGRRRGGKAPDPMFGYLKTVTTLFTALAVGMLVSALAATIWRAWELPAFNVFLYLLAQLPIGWVAGLWVFGVAYAVTALGLRSYQPWARPAAIAISMPVFLLAALATLGTLGASGLLALLGLEMISRLSMIPAVLFAAYALSFAFTLLTLLPARGRAAYEHQAELRRQAAAGASEQASDQAPEPGAAAA